jgi:hypothetical protein
MTFKGENLQKTVSSDGRGVYDVNLPFGLYTMTARPSKNLQPYQRPLFRVMAPTVITLDMYLDAQRSCDFGVPAGSNRIPDETFERETQKNICGGVDVFPAPSESGVPFQVSIRFESRKRTERDYVYSSQLPPGKYVAQVLVAYNLFTLRAGDVTYDEESRTLHATGHVIATDGTEKTRQADSMSFKLENGQATLISTRTGT